MKRYFFGSYSGGAALICPGAAEPATCGGVPLHLLQRQLGHADLTTTGEVVRRLYVAIEWWGP